MVDILTLAQVDKFTEPTTEEAMKGFQGDDVRFLSLILENEKNHPEMMDKIFWPFFDREQALTNFDNVDVAKQMLELHIATLNFKMSIPDFKKTYDGITQLDNMRAKLYAKLKRSTGGINRERAIQASHIKQLISSGMEEKATGGILSRLAGAFGGRK